MELVLTSGAVSQLQLTLMLAKLTLATPLRLKMDQNPKVNPYPTNELLGTNQVVKESV